MTADVRTLCEPIVMSASNRRAFAPLAAEAMGVLVSLRLRLLVLVLLGIRPGGLVI
jgi:hypothetical protein